MRKLIRYSMGATLMARGRTSQVAISVASTCTEGGEGVEDEGRGMVLAAVDWSESNEIRGSSEVCQREMRRGGGTTARERHSGGGNNHPDIIPCTFLGHSLPHLSNPQHRDADEEQL